VGLLLGSLPLTRNRSRLLTSAASLAVLAGSLAMRIRALAEGDRSAARPAGHCQANRPVSLTPA